MVCYTLIESRDPFECREVAADYSLARQLGKNGDEVTLFLVQNGVLPARRGARAAELERLVAEGTRVMADSFSMRERALASRDLREGVEEASLEVVLDALLGGQKVLWL